MGAVWICETAGCDEPARRMVGEQNERLACIPHAEPESPKPWAHPDTMIGRT